VIRVQIITPPGALLRSGQTQLAQDVTAILLEVQPKATLIDS
jgi:hypothetical protein